MKSSQHHIYSKWMLHKLKADLYETCGQPKIVLQNYKRISVSYILVIKKHYSSQICKSCYLEIYSVF